MERTLCSVSRTLHEGESIELVLERNEAAIQGTRRKGSQTPEELAKKWGIGVKTARRTIDRTTQLAVQDFHDSAGTRRLKHTYMQLQYRCLNCVMYTDTLFGPKPSSQKNTCGQVYSTAFDWCVFYPMKAECDAHLTLDLLHNDFGVPKTYTPDNAMALVKGNFEKKVHRGRISDPPDRGTYSQSEQGGVDCKRNQADVPAQNEKIAVAADLLGQVLWVAMPNSVTHGAGLTIFTGYDAHGEVDRGHR